MWLCGIRNEADEECRIYLSLGVRIEEWEKAYGAGTRASRSERMNIRFGEIEWERRIRWSGSRR